MVFFARAIGETGLQQGFSPGRNSLASQQSLVKLTNQGSATLRMVTCEQVSLALDRARLQPAN